MACLNIKVKLLQQQDRSNKILDEFIRNNADGFKKKFILFIAYQDVGSKQEPYKHYQFLCAVNAQKAMTETRRALKYDTEAFGFFFLSDPKKQSSKAKIMKDAGFHYLLNHMGYYF